MAKVWVDPRYRAALEEIGPVIVMGNCTNCGGAGRHIYVDPKDGKMKSLTCQACGGTGQKPE